MMILLAAALAVAQEEEVRAVFHLIRAVQEERPRLESSLKDVEGELKELSAYNAFEVVASAVVRYMPTGRPVRTSLVLRDGGSLDLQFGTEQSLGGRILFRDLSLTEHRVTEETTILNGVTVRGSRTIGQEVFHTTTQADEGKLRIVGTAVVTGKNGPIPVILAVRAQ